MTATACTCRPGFEPTGNGTELVWVRPVTDPWCPAHGTEEAIEVEG